MSDIRDVETELALRGLEDDICDEYDEASFEIEKTAESYLEKHKKEYDKKRSDLNDGTIAKAAFIVWGISSLIRNREWRTTQNRMAARITQAATSSANKTNAITPDIFMQNQRRTAYNIEMAKQINTMSYFSNERTAWYLNKTPGLLKNLSVSGKLHNAWMRNKLTSELLSGISKGYSIPKIAKSFERVSNMSRATAIRNARTAVTGAQNAGRLVAYQEAEKQGQNIQKEWIATKDGRTRDSHAWQDGERVNVNDYFSNGLMYPGDPSGAPSEVYNCRCTMREIMPENNEPRETYEEWAREKEYYIDSEVYDIKEHGRLNDIVSSLPAEAQRALKDTHFKTKTEYDENREPDWLKGASYYRPKEERVYLKENFSKREAYHEIGHALEEKLWSKGEVEALKKDLTRGLGSESIIKITSNGVVEYYVQGDKFVNLYQGHLNAVRFEDCITPGGGINTKLMDEVISSAVEYHYSEPDALKDKGIQYEFIKGALKK